MTNNIQAIADKYLSESKKAVEKSNFDPKFSVDSLVVNKTTGKQMRIKEITPEGKFKCFSNGGVTFDGEFSEEDLDTLN